MTTITYENNLMLVERHENHVAVVTLNNPPMNLNSVPSMEELREDFRKLEKDTDVRVILLIGKGKKAFNAGSDISGFKDMQGKFKMGPNVLSATGEKMKASIAS